MNQKGQPTTTIGGVKPLGTAHTTFDACTIARFAGLEAVRISGTDTHTGEKYRDFDTSVAELWEDVDLEELLSLTRFETKQ